MAVFSIEVPDEVKRTLDEAVQKIKDLKVGLELKGDAMIVASAVMMYLWLCEDFSKGRRIVTIGVSGTRKKEYDIHPFA